MTIAGLTKIVDGTSQTVFISDLISEGPIEGLVYGSASVFLDNARVVDVDDALYISENFAVNITFPGASSTGTVGGYQTFVPPALDSDNKKYLTLLEVSSISNVKMQLGGKSALPVATYGKKTLWLQHASDDLSAYNTSASTIARLVNNDGTLINGQEITGIIDVAVGRTNFYPNVNPELLDFVEDSYDYKIIIDQSFEISSMSASTIVLVSGTPAAGTHVFRVSSVHGTSNHAYYDRPGGEEQKFLETTVQFRNGTLSQSPLLEIGGVGNTSIAGTAGQILEQKSKTSPVTESLYDRADGSNLTADLTLYPSGYGALGTSPVSIDASADFNLSEAQIQEVDELRFTITYPSLTNVHQEKGDYSQTAAFYHIRFIPTIDGIQGDPIAIFGEGEVTHKGNFKSPHAFEHSILLESLRPFDTFKLEITRLNRHDGQGMDINGVAKEAEWVGNTTGTITALSSIIKEKFSFPYTAYAGVTFNSKEFSNLPVRSYHCRGLKVQIPNNYVTRERSDTGIAKYGAFWNGSFNSELHYTDNPAWIFYDIVSNNRYGVGEWITADEIDKYALYRIARYCDELVDDGSGGLEPRFRANLYLTKATDTYKVLKDMATIFMGMLYWIDGQLTPILDEPKDAVMNFSKGNVIDGRFNYENTGSKTRVNQVVVSYNNPNNNYELTPIIVEDRNAIIKLGKIVKQSSAAFGCTSEGQATRYGRWKLWTAQNQKEVVTFSSALNVGFLKPGDIINVQDADKYGIQYSGRIATTGTLDTDTVPLDREVTLAAGSVYTLSILITESAVFLTQDAATISSVAYVKGDMIPGYATESAASHIEDDSGDLVSASWAEHTRVETQTVSTGAGSGIVSLDVSTAFSAAPERSTIWALKETIDGVNVVFSAKYYRVLAITESSDNIYDITAVEHYNEKFDAVEKDYALGVIPDSLFPKRDVNDSVPAPANVYVLTGSDFRKIGEEITVQWDPPAGDYRFLVGYEIDHTVEGYDSPIPVSKYKNSYTFKGVPNGVHRFSVRTKAFLGDKSRWNTIVTNIQDPFSSDVRRTGAGVPLGANSTAGLFMKNDEATRDNWLTFKETVYALSPPQDTNIVWNSDGSPESTYSIDCAAITVQATASPTPIVDFLQSYFVLFDYSDAVASETPMRLCIMDIYSMTGIAFWNDINTTKYSSLTGTVSIDAGSNLVTGVSTLFTTELAVGDIIRLSDSGTPESDLGEYGAKVSAIVSNTKMFIDRSFDTAVSAYAYEELAFKVDYATDCVLAKVWKPNGWTSPTTVSMKSYLTIDAGLGKTFSQAVAPALTDYDLKEGDLWYNTATGNTPHRWNGTAWVAIEQSSVDKHVIVHWNDTEPAGGVSEEDDVWFDTNASDDEYVYDGATWNDVANSGYRRALSNYANKPTAPATTNVFWSDARAPLDEDARGGSLADGDIWHQINPIPTTYIRQTGAWVEYSDQYAGADPGIFNPIHTPGKDTYADTTAGFWLGEDGADTYKLNLGDVDEYLKWDGTSLIMNGGTFHSPAKTAYADDDNGFWAGNDSGTYKLYIGNATEYIKWDGTNLTSSIGSGGSGWDSTGFDLTTTTSPDVFTIESKIGLGSVETLISGQYGDAVKLYFNDSLSLSTATSGGVTVAGTMAANAVTTTTSSSLGGTTTCTGSVATPQVASASGDLTIAGVVDLHLQTGTDKQIHFDSTAQLEMPSGGQTMFNRNQATSWANMQQTPTVAIAVVTLDGADGTPLGANCGTSGHSNPGTGEYTFDVTDAVTSVNDLVICATAYEDGQTAIIIEAWAVDTNTVTVKTYTAGTTEIDVTRLHVVVFDAGRVP